MPTLRAISTINKQGTPILTEGWALRPSKRAYYFIEKQKAYLTAKFNIGQSTGQKVDTSFVARDMRHAHGSNGERLFKSSDYFIFYTPFSDSSPTDIAAREHVMATITIQHPITSAPWQRKTH